MSLSIADNCIGCGACKRVCPVGAITGEKKEIHSIDGSLCIECEACGRVCPKSAVSDSSGIPVAMMKKKEWPKPVIDSSRCYACENCVAACPTGALAMKSEVLPFGENLAVLESPDLCVSCRWCLENCQFGAIIMESVYARN